MNLKSNVTSGDAATMLSDACEYAAAEVSFLQEDLMEYYMDNISLQTAVRKYGERVLNLYEMTLAEPSER